MLRRKNTINRACMKILLDFNTRTKQYMKSSKDLRGRTFTLTALHRKGLIEPIPAPIVEQALGLSCARCSRDIKMKNPKYRDWYNGPQWKLTQQGAEYVRALISLPVDSSQSMSVQDTDFERLEARIIGNKFNQVDDPELVVPLDKKEIKDLLKQAKRMLKKLRVDLTSDYRSFVVMRIDIRSKKS